ncbi:putative polyketide synthase [Aspergillus steynii IBT 23096]|uniref:Putative polyketide synthase n=1 Tax=Aspergillus steynii IBT 23096 TaxID=1392250 RepID=A0A2I2FWN1_9EURO|nr:putative polyketide synthase [Aspergillus steynii IBT 23096]PLB45025.1 putative polyketide synthase [Aspergillus steynii IBT 23096]
MTRSGTEDDIAIIGMACRVPGADSSSQLWEMLAAKKDVRRRIDRFNIDGYYSSREERAKGLTDVQHAYLLDQDVDKFDHAFFGISPIEASAMDPQHRMLLEVAYEGVESAGIRLEDIQGTNTAVYAGISCNDYQASLLRDLEHLPRYAATGMHNSMAANRVSYFFDLHGPSMTIDTACSSTMVALNQAVRGLQGGESGMALVCGSHLILNPDMFVHMSELGFLTPGGRCRSFDAQGDGYARGEGCLALLLKPLAQAIRDHDPIRAVIKGTQLNHDGKTQGITLPSASAQQQNLDTLYQRCGIPPRQVQYVEAHGTGTAAGDPIECAALARVFRPSDTPEDNTQRLVIGSIKSNIGHLESCAGLAGIIKTVESLERGLIPAQMNYDTPNPKIPHDRLLVPKDTMPWPATPDAVRRAGINSFGFGGTNGHVILEQYVRQEDMQLTAPYRRPYLFKVSAGSEISLRGLAARYATAVDELSPHLVDLAFTLLSRRSTLSKTVYFVASSAEETKSHLGQIATGEIQPVSSSPATTTTMLWIFTGQGAQWPQMGRQLLDCCPLFSAVIHECDRALACLPDPPAWSLVAELLQPKSSSRIQEAAYSQPLCTAIQIALAEKWRSFGIAPTAVVGHSSGEIGAAYAAGILSLTDAMAISYYRGLFVHGKDEGPKGAMCAVGLEEELARQILVPYDGRVSLAAVNAPTSCTISGDADAVTEIHDLLKAQGRFCRMLHVDTAYHSHHMLPAASRYIRALDAAGIRASSSPARCKMYSSVSGRLLDPADNTSQYWRDNMVSTVRFTDAIKAAVENHSPFGSFLEIGPHPALKGPTVELLSTLGIREARYWGSCSRGKPDLEAILNSTAQMIHHGFPIRLDQVNSPQLGSEYNGRVVTGLPGYAWDHSVGHWAESRLSLQVKNRCFARCPLLGARMPGDNPILRLWNNIWRRKEMPWIERIEENHGTKVPQAAFIIMALEATQQIIVEERYSTTGILALESIDFHGHVSLSHLESESDNPFETNLRMQRITSTTYEFSIVGGSATIPWQQICSGHVSLKASIPAAPTQESIKNGDAMSSDGIAGIQIYHTTESQVSGATTIPLADEETGSWDPLILETLLRLNGKILGRGPVPSEYDLRAIERLAMPIAYRPSLVKFHTKAARIHEAQGVGEIQIGDTAKSPLTITGLQYQFQKRIQEELPLDSLFLCPTILPDISCLTSVPQQLSLGHLLTLVCHKWPMCDIALVGLNEALLREVHSQLPEADPYHRPSFRLVDVIGTELAWNTSRWYSLDHARPKTQYHLVLGTVSGIRRCTPSLHRKGLLAVTVHDESDGEWFASEFDKVAAFDGVGSTEWAVGQRRTALRKETPMADKTLVLQCEGTKLVPSARDLDFQPVNFHLPAVREQVEERPDTERLDVVILDMAQRSILLDVPGDKLLPTLQYLIPRTRSLVWVSSETEGNPFRRVVPSFLRTLMSEYPSLRALSLLICGEHSIETIGATILDAQQDLLMGETETDMIVKDSQLHLLRYRPDDELAAAVGRREPRESVIEASGLELTYDIVPAEPGSLMAVLHLPQLVQCATTGTVRVQIDASVIDPWDCQVVRNHRAATVWPGFGHFFSGTIISSKGSHDIAAKRVVGWNSGAHSRHITVPAAQVWPITSDLNPHQAAVQLAVHAIALAAIRGTARCLPTERIAIGIPGALGDALRNVCRVMDLAFEEDEVQGHRSMGDKLFRVHADSGSLSVDNTPVDIETYLKGGDRILAELATDRFQLNCQVPAFPIADYQEAFDHAASNRTPTVLLHDHTRTQIRGIITYRQPHSIFKPNGAYVLLGGSGGLGQHLIRWMVRQGARHLVIVSRSGMKAEDERSLRRDIDVFNAILEVRRADATKRPDLEAALCDVRARGKILGCMNLVMVLQDSPFDSMTGAQWDMALEAKVQSTNNLHLATLQDPLDFFILFSSIASIAGNMAQANYATANAYQNSIAADRRASGLPGMAIALGVMTGIGVLTDEQNLLQGFSQKGMTLLSPDNLCKIVETAVQASQYSDRSLLPVGFDMFQSLDGAIQRREDQRQLFWAETAEFGFLFDHKVQEEDNAVVCSLRDQLLGGNPGQGLEALLKAFLAFLGSILGYEADSLDPSRPMASFGLDSLNAVTCRFWFFQELAVDVPLFQVLGADSVTSLLQDIRQEFLASHGSASDTTSPSTALPMPVAQSASGPLMVRPVSHSQHRIWFLQQLLTDKTVYNLLLVCHIAGEMDVPAFLAAWSTLMKRHEILRSCISDTADGLQQIPKDSATFPLTVIKANGSKEWRDVEAEVTRLARGYVFDLEGGDVIHGWLVQNPAGWKFYLASHHLAWDRSSVPVIFEETSHVYQNILAGRSPEAELSPVPYQFVDYTLWQNEVLEQESLVKGSLEYWMSELDGIPDAITLLPSASVASRPLVQQYQTDTSLISLDAALASRLKSFCREHAVTPFMFMTACLSILLHRLTGDQDILIGIADGDRSHTAFDRLVGFTVNMLALRFRMNPKDNVHDFLGKAKQTCVQAYKHRILPFDYLLQHLNVPRAASHSPIFQVMVNYQMQAAFPEYDYGTFRFTGYDHYNARPQADFYLEIEETAQGALDCFFRFDTALYTHQSMTDLSYRYQALLESVLVADGEDKLGSLHLLSTADQELVHRFLRPEYRNYPTPVELSHDLFLDRLQDAVHHNPSKLAVFDKDETLTYQDLDERSDMVASALRRHGVLPGDSVGLVGDACCSIIAAICGVLKAGGVYVPIDREYPLERIQNMAADAGFRALLISQLSESEHQKLRGIPGTQLINVQQVLSSTSSDYALPFHRADASDSFCAVFTSGTTGKPKGIYIGQTQLRCEMEGCHRVFQTTSEDRLLLSSSLTFDMHLISVYGFVLYGATLCIADRETMLSPSSMVNWVVDSQISSLMMTPTQAQLLVTAPNADRLRTWTCLRSFSLGGEPVDPSVVGRLYELGLPSASVYNAYGPSETTVGVSIHRFDSTTIHQEVSVGGPIYPSSFYILDEHLNEVPPGTPGELYIGGPTVNAGYINRPEKTAAVFMNNPWATEDERTHGYDRLYRTGDRFLLSHDGKLYIQGRVAGDRQVKIRGMRTELTEIEQALSKTCQNHVSSHQVSFVAVAHYKTSTDGGTLVAFIVAPKLAEDDLSTQQQIRSIILSDLRSKLPFHMIPSALEFRTSLPLLVSGKIDYKTLQSCPPPSANCHDCGITSKMVGANGAEANLTPLQSRVALIWASVLGGKIAADQVDPEADFFSVGGHSLLLFRLQSGITEDFQISIPLRELFTASTVAAQATLIQSTLQSQQQPSSGSTIDWDSETALPKGFPAHVQPLPGLGQVSGDVALTGGCTMIGAHFVHHLLTTTPATAHCLAIEAESREEAKTRLLNALQQWNLLQDLDDEHTGRLLGYPGFLSHPTLGLSEDQIQCVDEATTALYQIDSEVSLFKSYAHLTTSNLGSIRFLLNLATRNPRRAKPLHYLSTWGVPHLQSWSDTELPSRTWEAGPVALTHMRPGTDDRLGYLKCRWACERLLYRAAERGLPVSIFRPSMCTPAPGRRTTLARTDINRRILVGSLQVGMVPDFNSDRGGGMSWITADFLVQSILYLSQRAPTAGDTPLQIHHVVAPQHTPYSGVPSALFPTQSSLKSVPPRDWFAALRASQDPEMAMQAAVLEEWYSAGWVSFPLESSETHRRLCEAGIVSRPVDSEMLQDLVIGDGKF